MNTKRLLIAAAMVTALTLTAACTQAQGSTPTPRAGLPPAGTTTGGSGASVTGGVAPQGTSYPYFAPGQAAYGAQQSGIWVSGLGRVVVVPDLALLNLGVEARAKTVQQARDDAAAAMDKVMTVLTSSGVQKKDIKTQYFNIQPEYIWNDFAKRQEITGYRVTNTVSAKVRDLEGVGALIDRVADAGGDLVRINGISFTVEEPENYAAQAREAAVKDAVAKAQQFAKLTGVKLGKLAYISESGASIPVVRDYAEAKILAAGAALPSTPVSPGEMDVTVSVQAVFGIE